MLLNVFSFWNMYTVTGFHIISAVNQFPALYVQ